MREFVAEEIVAAERAVEREQIADYLRRLAMAVEVPNGVLSRILAVVAGRVTEGVHWSDGPAAPITATEEVQAEIARLSDEAIAQIIAETRRQDAEVPTNEQLRVRAERDFADGEPAWEAVRGWLDRHTGRPPIEVDTRDEWLNWAASNFVNDPELAPYLIDRGKLHDLRQTLREQERRMAYEYLKEAAEELRRHPPGATGTGLMNVGTAANNLVRVAGEILRGLHANPVKINNPELWQ